jgi:hypothetical protein
MNQIIKQNTMVSDNPKFHGIESAGALSFGNSSHVLTIASGTNKYWHNGISYLTSSAITCDLDSYVTLTTNTLYYVYFDDASGVLKASASAWDLKTKVPVVTVYWNGSAGSVQKEIHNHTRDLDWHINAHLTIGARYGSGLSLTAPTTVNDAVLQIESGSIWDEDLQSTIAQQTTMRGWYKASANVFTFTDYSLPFVGSSSSQVQFLDTDTYSLANVGSSKFVCMWVYATNDIDRPIHIIPSHVASDYNTIALARAETAPDLGLLGVNPEMKLIYRFIYRGDGQFQEHSDYRLTSPLPSGGSASTTASAVSFTPSGNIASTTVQTALEELDTKKASTAYVDSVAGGGLALNKYKLESSFTTNNTDSTGVGITGLSFTAGANKKYRIKIVAIAKPGTGETVSLRFKSPTDSKLSGRSLVCGGANLYTNETVTLLKYASGSDSQMLGYTSYDSAQIIADFILDITTSGEVALKARTNIGNQFSGFYEGTFMTVEECQ